MYYVVRVKLFCDGRPIGALERAAEQAVWFEPFGRVTHHQGSTLVECELSWRFDNRTAALSARERLHRAMPKAPTALFVYDKRHTLTESDRDSVAWSQRWHAYMVTDKAVIHG